MGIGAAGKIGAYSTLKGMVNVHNLKAATATTTWTANTQNGTGKIVVPNGYDGAFLGMALSGSGVPAPTVGAKMDPDGKTIQPGSATGTPGDKTPTPPGNTTTTRSL